MTMKPILMAFILSGLVAGCAERPGDEVRDARDEEIEAAREQREETVERAQDRTEQRAEERYEDLKQRAERLPPGTQERVEAEAKMAQQRVIERSRAMERLQKADARIAEARAKAANARSVPLEVTTQIDNAAAQRDATSLEIKQLQTVSIDGWETAMRRVEMQLDELEMTVARALERANSLQ